VPKRSDYGDCILNASKSVPSVPGVQGLSILHIILTYYDILLTHNNYEVDSDWSLGTLGTGCKIPARTVNSMESD
jgi:hypothetical protein